MGARKPTQMLLGLMRPSVSVSKWRGPRELAIVVWRREQAHKKRKAAVPSANLIGQIDPRYATRPRTLAELADEVRAAGLPFSWPFFGKISK